MEQLSVRPFWFSTHQTQKMLPSAFFQSIIVPLLFRETIPSFSAPAFQSTILNQKSKISSLLFVSFLIRTTNTVPKGEYHTLRVLPLCENPVCPCSSASFLLTFYHFSLLVTRTLIQVLHCFSCLGRARLGHLSLLGISSRRGKRHRHGHPSEAIDILEHPCYY